MATRPGTARVPDKMRVYAIGDVHGRADLLQQMLQMIAQDMKDIDQELCSCVFLGDYLNRGPATKGVIETLVSRPMAPARHTFLRGNHEQVLLGFLNDPGGLAQFLRYGGSATLASYGIEVFDARGRLRADRELHRAFLDALPESHLKFFRELILYSVIGDYLFVHAGIRPGVALDNQQPADLVSIREPFLSFEGELPYVVVHGHTRVSEPEIRAARIAIDTGAFKTGRLTCLVLEQDQRRFLMTSGNAIAAHAACRFG